MRIVPPLRGVSACCAWTALPAKTASAAAASQTCLFMTPDPPDPLPRKFHREETTSARGEELSWGPRGWSRAVPKSPGKPLGGHAIAVATGIAAAGEAAGGGIDRH